LLTLLTPQDDSFHARPVGDPDWTETLWLAFAIPERRLSGVTYLVTRPNRGVCSLGVWMWDHTARNEPEVLYFQNHPELATPGDMADFELPCGFSQRVVEPGRRYEVSYDDGAELRLQLSFAALHEPVGREFGGEISGSNQLGTVTGDVWFNGDRFGVECHEFRGRSWSSRSDRRMVLRPDAAGDLMVHADTYAIAAGTSFFVTSMGGLATTDVLSGHLLRDGTLEAIVEGQRSVERHPVHGFPERVTIDAADAMGRTTRATGVCTNQLLMTTVVGVPFPFWVCGTNWTIDGEPGWGQDQDVPVGRPAPQIADITSLEKTSIWR
jgi:hypothetical protein